MRGMTGSRDRFPHTCTPVERSIEIGVDHVAKSHGLTFANWSGCDDLWALGSLDINENRISFGEFDFPGGHSEHT